VSRFFPSLRLSEMPDGKRAPSDKAIKGEDWPDLMSPLERESKNMEPAHRVSAARLGTREPEGLNAGILGALGQLDRSDGMKTLKDVVDADQEWADLVPAEESQPDILAEANPVACRPRKEERVLEFGDFPASAGESFQVLCQRLLQVRQERRLQSILITSPVPREGKTVVSINLSATLARSSPAVLLIDADLRHPRTQALGIEPGPGLSDYLAGQAELSKTIRRVTPLGFHYLQAGFANVNPTELLQKPALQAALTQAVAAFDWVIVDSPSINLFADSRYLATIVDGVLLVVREGVTPRDFAIKSLAALDKSFVVGIVFNASTGSPYAHYDQADRIETVGEKTSAGRDR
jgi:protein-tyrosine kinase